jgi:transcriptional regulator with XRE-family HTH domain
MKTQTDEAGPELYQARLFRIAKDRKKYRLGFRDIAAEVGLSVTTVRDALAGNALKLDALWKLARYFDIPWLALFDIDRKLTVDLVKDPDADRYFCKYLGFEITGASPDLVTPDPALGSQAERGAEK